MILTKAEQLACEVYKDPRLKEILLRAMPSVAVKEMRGRPRKGHLETLAKETCVRHGVVRSALDGRRRTAKVIQVRSEFCRVAYQDGATLTEIAKFLGRTHAAVLNLLRKEWGQQ